MGEGRLMILRVAEVGRPAFQLRKGEEGISVFDSEAVDPPLDDAEVLSCFRPGSILIRKSLADIQAKGLVVVPLPGAAALPPRLQAAHREVGPGPGMSRPQFKQALKDLE
jgi:hypothetical protein